MSEEDDDSGSRLGPPVPDVEVPEVDGPAVDGPATPEAGESPEFDDADPAVQRLFWRLVLVFDVALLALALGPMFVYFRGDWSTGGPLLALGAVAFLYGVSEYRDYRTAE